jgi:hypothetical protein
MYPQVISRCSLLGWISWIFRDIFETRTYSGGVCDAAGGVSESNTDNNAGLDFLGVTHFCGGVLWGVIEVGE